MRHTPSGGTPFYSIYGHLTKGSNASLPNGPGDIVPGRATAVKPWSALGQMGQTGGATGPHLHVEIRPIKKDANGKELPFYSCDPIDPKSRLLPYEPFNGKWKFEFHDAYSDLYYNYVSIQQGRSAKGTHTEDSYGPYFDDHHKFNYDVALLDDPINDRLTYTSQEIEPLLTGYAKLTQIFPYYNSDNKLHKVVLGLESKRFSFGSFAILEPQ